MGALSGKSVLITGASAGIGRATALALAGEGARIIATGRRTAELDAIETKCRERGGDVETIAGDLNDDGFIARLAEAARDVDILVNNAGILTYAPLLDTK